MPIQLVSVAVHANLCTKSGNNNAFARILQQKPGAIPSKDRSQEVGDEDSTGGSN